MLETITNYKNETLEYFKGVLDNIITTLNTTKEVISQIGDAIGTLAQILGFIGFRVCVLLMITAFVVWICNLCSPTTKKANYFSSIAFVIWIAINANMPMQIVIFKYILIILAPMLITNTIGYLLRITKIAYKISDKKVSLIVAKTNIIPTNFKIPETIKPTIIFSSTLPSNDDIERIKGKYMENEKVLLIDDKGSIVFDDENKFLQFKKAVEDKESNIMWCWNSEYGSNNLLSKLMKTPKIMQKKYIVGSGDNSFILNFLQNSWNWKIIYAKNYIDFLEEEIELKPIEYQLKLINNFDFKNKYAIKKKIIASDISVFAFNRIEISNKILYLSGNSIDEVTLYRNLLKIGEFIINKKQKPVAIIIADIIINANIGNIIKDFNKYLELNLIYIPILYAEHTNMIISNENCMINYDGNNILMKNC
jgi:hypothetical protein